MYLASAPRYTKKNGEKIEMAPTLDRFIKKHEGHYLRDPAVEKLTRGDVTRAIDEYISLLDASSDEKEIHNIIKENSYFFYGLMRMRGQSPLYSKVKLGNEYETDFLYFDLSSFGPDWKLIEIESPRANIFRKNGDTTAEFNHAIQQIRNWHDWITENLSYARTFMPGIRYPYGYLFIGRRAELTPRNKETMKRISYDCRSFAHIHTLDRLTDWARRALHDMKGEVGGSWTVPLRAFSHKDLLDRQPTETFYWLDRDLSATTADMSAIHLQEWHSNDYPGGEGRAIDGDEDLGY